MLIDSYYGATNPARLAGRGADDAERCRRRSRGGVCAAIRIILKLRRELRAQ
jgi:hypothetical protein